MLTLRGNWGKQQYLEHRLQVTKYHQNGFHASIRRTLQTSRMLGILPLSGLGNPSSRHLRFTFLSPYSLLYFANLTGQSVLFALNWCWLLQNNTTLTNIRNALFYTLCFFTTLILTNISRSWPSLIAEVEEIEKTLPPFKRNVPVFCNVIILLLFLSATVEHLFSHMYDFTAAKYCNSTNAINAFLHYNRPYVFNYVSYSLWKGILVEIINFQASITWSYNDALVIVTSIYLAEHFVIHNQHLTKASKQENLSCEEFRNQYSQIVRLVRLINNRIGMCVLVCFMSNLYWICTQLFYSLNKNYPGHAMPCISKIMNAPKRTDNSIEHTIYFIYSLGFLLARAFLVLIFAARVHSTSIVPLTLLYEIPANKFTIETDRYIAQVNNVKIALTGYDFFYVTRSMILTLLSTVVTYELVLLQFNN